MMRLAQTHPVHLAAALFLVILALRLLDVFLLRLDERFGEQFLTKAVGLLLVLLYLWSAGHRVASIGLHAARWQFSIALGLAVMTAGLTAGYGVEWLLLHAQGAQPGWLLAPQPHVLVPGAIVGGVVLGLTLVGGNVVNAFMEEALFRGVLLTHLATRMRFAKANVLQAVLFGLWHLVWPARDYLDGKTGLQTALGTALGYVLLSALIGYAWGYLVQKTNSLWTAWAAHMLNNTVINFIHISTAAGLASTLGVRVGVATLVVLLLLPLAGNAVQSRTTVAA